MASYLGRSGCVDFIYCDRTFSSLYGVVEATFGKWAIYGLRIIFLGEWEFVNTVHFVNSGCYKVVGCDPNDEII